MNKKRDEDDSFTSEISCPFAMVALVLFDAKLNLTASDYRVYGQIYKRGYGSKKGCIQRQKGLCEEAGVKKSQFIESTNKLVALGVLIKIKGPRNTTHYKVVVDPRDWVPIQEPAVQKNALPDENEWSRKVDHSSPEKWTTPPPLPNNKDLTRSPELDPIPHDGVFEPSTRATDPIVISSEDFDIEIEAIKAFEYPSEGKRIASPTNASRKASNKSIGASAEVLKYPFLIRDWMELLFEVSPQRKKSPPNRQKWDKALERLSAYLGRDEEGLREILEFIKQDIRPEGSKETFPGWHFVATSPTTLMEFSDKEERKIDKILKAMDRKNRSVQPLSKSDVKKIQSSQAMEDAVNLERLRDQLLQQGAKK